MQRYAITDRKALHADASTGYAALLEQAARWVVAGVEWVQLREKDLHPEPLQALAKQFAERVAGSPTRLLVNGLSPETAQRCGAHGVHLRSGTSAAGIRQAAGAVRYVSVSCHTLTDVQSAVQGGASALLWAPVFEKLVNGKQVSPATGLAALRDACHAAQGVPVIALGGITLTNAPLCMQAGAAGVAGIRLFAGSAWERLR